MMQQMHQGCTSRATITWPMPGQQAAAKSAQLQLHTSRLLFYTDILDAKQVCFEEDYRP